MYVITGATGNTGRVVAEQLLHDGKDVKVVSRKSENVQELVNKGATSAIGDLADKDFVKQAFEGAQAVYAVIPPNFNAEDFRGYQNEIGNNLADAIEANQVPYAATLSSFGAHLPEGSGVVNGLYDFEQRLNGIQGLNVVHLRAGFFHQNFYANLPLLEQKHILGGFPLDGNVKIPMVHTSDIGRVAAQRLSALDFQGVELHEVAGAKDYTMQEAAQIIGDAFGLDDVQYVAFSYEDARDGMVQMGMSESLADAYITFSKAVNEGRLYEGYQRNEQNTTETTLEYFAANELVHAYQSA